VDANLDAWMSDLDQTPAHHQEWAENPAGILTVYSKRLVLAWIVLAWIVLSGCERAGKPAAFSSPELRVSALHHRAECVIDDGLVGCRGDGDRGVLGDGRAEPTTSSFRRVEPIRQATALAISASAIFACAVSHEQLWCWGDNQGGVLGRPTRPGVDARPTVVPGLPPVRKVAAGLDHVCALSVDAVTYCWGVNSVGEVADPRTEPRMTIDTPVQVAVPGEVRDLFLTFAQSCAVTRDDSVYCWGGSVPGASGPTTAMSPTHVAAGARALPRTVELGRACVDTRDGDVCWSNADEETLRHYQEPHLQRRR